MAHDYWFTWKGRKSTELGIYVSNPPDIIMPSERATFVTVPGRNGSLTILEDADVYDDILMPVECVMRDMSRIDEIGGYLHGAGKLILAERPNGYYKGRVVNQIDFRRVMRGRQNREFTVNFRLEPFWYTSAGASKTFTSPGTFTNPGNVPSKCRITVVGTGDAMLSIGAQGVALSRLTNKIVLDGGLMEAYNDSASMNGNMSGDFPRILPGNNAIQWSGAITSVTIDTEFAYRI